MLVRIIFISLLFSLFNISLQARCGYKNKIPIKSLTSAFPVWKVVTDAMQECGNFKADLDNEFRKKQPGAFAVSPSLYHIGGVATSTFVALKEAGTIRNLNNLVKRYGKQLKPSQLIKHDGKVMAIAMMVNLQHFMYRKDIFKKLKLKAPQSYDEVIKLAKKIKKAGVIDYPLGGTYKAGWNIAQEFVNLYLGFGGTFFTKGNQPSINNRRGVKSLEMMKKLTAYMDPEYLQADSTYVQKQFQQGKIAMANLWNSRAAAMNNKDESLVVDKVEMSSAPSSVPGGKPASTLWWDGIVIAKNIKDREAEAAFRVAMEGMDREVVEANNDVAIWLVDGYQATDISAGAVSTVEKGVSPYPASSAMAIIHTALGNRIADYLTGRESASKTLAKIEEDYRIAAKEKGLIK